MHREKNPIKSAEHAVEGSQGKYEHSQLLSACERQWLYTYYLLIQTLSFKKISTVSLEYTTGLVTQEALNN